VQLNQALCFAAGLLLLVGLNGNTHLKGASLARGQELSKRTRDAHASEDENGSGEWHMGAALPSKAG